MSKELKLKVTEFRERVLPLRYAHKREELEKKRASGKDGRVRGIAQARESTFVKKPVTLKIAAALAAFFKIAIYDLDEARRVQDGKDDFNKVKKMLKEFDDIKLEDIDLAVQEFARDKLKLDVKSLRNFLIGTAKRNASIYSDIRKDFIAQLIENKPEQALMLIGAGVKLYSQKEESGKKRAEELKKIIEAKIEELNPSQADIQAKSFKQKLKIKDTTYKELLLMINKNYCRKLTETESSNHFIVAKAFSLGELGVDEAGEDTVIEYPDDDSQESPPSSSESKSEV